jgi:hypothetical protein
MLLLSLDKIENASYTASIPLAKTFVHNSINQGRAAPHRASNRGLRRGRRRRARRRSGGFASVGSLVRQSDRRVGSALS